MALDVRLPLGLLFVVLGVLLAGSGLFGSGSSQLNLWWGLVLLSFGAVMLWLARRARIQ
jgi:hypothetical protein